MFELLGKNEDDISYSIRLGSSKIPVFLKLFIGHIGITSEIVFFKEMNQPIIITQHTGENATFVKIFLPVIGLPATFAPKFKTTPSCPLCNTSCPSWLRKCLFNHKGHQVRRKGHK